MICMLAGGCAATVPTASPSGRTLIESDPPGARIDIGGQYVGTTPLRVNIPRQYDVYGGTYNNILVVANPITPGQQVQSKMIRYDEGTPTHMFFNMNLVSVPNSSNLNVNLGSPQNANKEVTPEEVKIALAKARANGDKKFEGEILQYAKEHGINVE